MKYALFFLKMRQYRWSAALLTLLCALSLCTNILLSSLLLNTHPITVFVPTNTGDSFTYDGTFTPVYFERIATFLSQRLLSFYPQKSDLHTIEPLIHPQAQGAILSQQKSFTNMYKAKHIQGFFAPQSAVFAQPNTVTIQGATKLFVDKQFLREQPLTVKMSFCIFQGRCLLKSLDVKPEPCDNTPLF